MAIGVNYRDHATEQAAIPPETPIVFALWSNSLSCHDDTVTWDGAQTSQVDFEVELGVVLGRDARDVAVENALDYVFGYTVVNDISARDLQFLDQQWSRSKSLDGFTPVGPVVVTADEIPDPQGLTLWCDVDGERLQHARHASQCRCAYRLPVAQAHLGGRHADLHRDSWRRRILS
jgi:2-keto-4-pentenoate hydratase/2-oxohepta-3-ene-1,7-dioic acid hydratase in catechol pathway